ncbi:MAG: hypothetical protein PW735_09180 [Acidobacteriaceae bacterium]|nr:hypothetical protein [Acidobacteriaceae bacterium]
MAKGVEKRSEFAFPLPEKPLQPAQAGRWMRKALAEQLPEMVRGLVKGAREGSCQHMKLATDLLRVEEPVKRAQKSTVKRLLEEFGAE